MRSHHAAWLLVPVLTLSSCATEMTRSSIRSPRLHEHLATPEGAMDALQAAFDERQCELFATVYDPSLVSGDGTEPPKATAAQSDFDATVDTFQHMCESAESVTFSFTPRRVDVGGTLGYPASDGYVTMLATDVSYRIYSPDKDECCRDIRMEGGRMLFVLQEAELDGERVWRIVHERELDADAAQTR